MSAGLVGNIVAATSWKQSRLTYLCTSLRSIPALLSVPADDCRPVFPLF